MNSQISQCQTLSIEVYSESGQGGTTKNKDMHSRKGQSAKHLGGLSVCDGDEHALAIAAQPLFYPILVALVGEKKIDEQAGDKHRGYST